MTETEKWINESLKSLPHLCAEIRRLSEENDAFRAQQEAEQKSPCTLCGYSGKHLDAPPCTRCPAYPKETEKNEPITLDELREMDGEPVWIVIIDHDSFADKNDDFDGWGLCRKSWVRMWDEKRADLVHADHHFEDYGKTWMAYRRKPEETT